MERASEWQSSTAVSVDIADMHKVAVYSQNFVGGTAGSANDQYGHGTHVAGIIAGPARTLWGPTTSTHSRELRMA